MKQQRPGQIVRPLKTAMQGMLLATCLVFGSPGHAGITFEFQYKDAPGTGFFDATYGASRQNALNTAAAGFSSMFGSHFTNSGTILLEASSTYDTLDGALASASSYFYPGDTGFKINEIIIDKLTTGNDFNGEKPDGVLNINFGRPWELDINQSVVPSWGWYSQGTYDFYGTLYHEFTHALGFNSTISSSGQSLYGDRSWSRFDSFLLDKNDVPIIDPHDFGLDQAAWDAGSVGNWAVGGSEGLFFGGSNTVAANSGYSVTLYTPDEWESGSSVAHLDGRFPGREGMMMTQSSGAGPQARDYSAIEVGMLTDLGYSVAVVPEPQTYAMMLAGLAMLGCIAARRRTSWMS